MQITLNTISAAQDMGLVRVGCTSFPGGFESKVPATHRTHHSSPSGGFVVYWATPDAVAAAGCSWREGVNSSEHLKRCRIVL